MHIQTRPSVHWLCSVNYHALMFSHLHDIFSSKVVLLLDSDSPLSLLHTSTLTLLVEQKAVSMSVDTRWKSCKEREGMGREGKSKGSVR